MKKAYIKIPARPKSYLPKISSRRMGLVNFITAAYKSDGEGDDGDDSPEKQLLQKIQQRVKAEIESRGFQNADAVSKQITDTLQGLNLDALRSFDPTKINDSVLKLAGEVEKIKQMPLGGEQRMNAIKALLADENNMKLIERAFNKTSGQTVTLNTRAAVSAMTTGNVVSDGDIPEDILNSFSVDSFVKKRRPNEFIFDIADRSTVAEITEYKTWLEEGDEEGAFAVVSEGAVKPLVSKTLVRNTSKYKKVAGKRVYTEEFAKFRKEAYRILEQLFNDQLLRNYAALLVTELDAKAASYVGTSLDDQFTNPTDYHAIGAVAAQIESLDFVPDTLIINPQDKWRIGLQQTTDGAFMVTIPMVSNGGGVTMMGFTVVTSNRVPVGSAYLGEGGLFKIEDEAVTIRMGYGINVTTGVIGTSGASGVTAVDHDFDNNRFRIIAETFFHAYIGTNYSGSFVKFNFATVKSALLKP